MALTSTSSHHDVNHNDLRFDMSTKGDFKRIIREADSEEWEVEQTSNGHVKLIPTFASEAEPILFALHTKRSGWPKWVQAKMRKVKEQKATSTKAHRKGKTNVIPFEKRGQNEKQSQMQVHDSHTKKRRHEKARDHSRLKQRDVKIWAHTLHEAIQSRQSDERVRLERAQSIQAAQLEDELDREYGKSRQWLEQQIDAITQRQEHGGFWYGINFRQRWEDCQTLPTLRASMENSLSREEEARNAYKNEYIRQWEALEQRHVQERKTLEQRVAQAFETGSIPALTQ